MFKRILVPIDGSTSSNAGVEVAVSLAAEQRAHVVFCTVLEPLPADIPEAPPAALEHAKAEAVETWWAERLLENAARVAEKAGVSATTTIATGDVVTAILDTGRREYADLIIIGSHGHGGLERALLGSKAEGVSRQARIPVLIVPGRAYRVVPEKFKNPD